MAELKLRTTKKRGTATLQVRIMVGGERFWLDSHITVDIASYSKAMKSSAKMAEYVTTPEGERVASLSVRYMDELKKAIKSGITDPNELDERLQDIVFADTRKALKEAQEEKIANEKKKHSSILAFFDDFTKRMREGLLLHHNGREYSESSILIWKKFDKYLRGYLGNNYDIMFSDITRPFADQFTAYLKKAQLMPKTINMHRQCFRKLCRIASQEGINENGVSLSVWGELTVEAKEKKAELYLTDEELDALFNMPLMGEQATVRDIFLLGCFSCQRFSDYGNLEKSNFTTDENTGLKLFSITQRKTGHYVEVPITDERVNVICERYNYKFPKLSMVKVNREIKIILKALSKSVPSLAELNTTLLSHSERKAAQDFKEYTKRVNKGGTKALDARERNIYYKLRKKAYNPDGGELYQSDNAGQIIRPKYELISSHSARRSGVTNLYKTGLLDTREMMSISGHQSERVFEEYIKVGTREQANKVADKLMKKKQQNNTKKAG